MPWSLHLQIKAHANSCKNYTGLINVWDHTGHIEIKNSFFCLFVIGAQYSTEHIRIHKYFSNEQILWLKIVSYDGRHILEPHHLLWRAI